jgi:putative PIN family toxin of toxin-antitoxin system
MTRIVLDTNVIVSALVFGGVPRAVLELAEAGQFELFYSEAIQAEVRRVLAEKFNWAPAMSQQVLPTLWSMGELVSPEIVVRAVPDDDDDNRIVECALAADASFIISGDHHLLALRAYKTISIITPRRFLEALPPDRP